MAANYTAVDVYRAVLDDVVGRVRSEFVGEGVDESVLDELRDLWEAKLTASGCLDDVASTPAPPPVPRPSTVRRAAAAAAAPAPAPVVPDAARALLGGGPVTGGPAVLAALAAANAARVAAAAAVAGAPPPGAGAAAARVAPLPVPGAPVVAPLPLGGGGGAPPHAVAPLPLGGGGGGGGGDASPTAKRARTLPQTDGPAGEGDGAPGASAAGASADAAAAPPAAPAAADDFNDVPSSDEEGDADPPDTCLALFDKVSRTRNKWKAALRACVLHVGGADSLVAAANGEFEF